MSTTFVLEIGFRTYEVPSDRIDSVLKCLNSLKEVKVNKDYRGYHRVSDARPTVYDCKLAQVTETDPTPAKPGEEDEEEGA